MLALAFVKNYVSIPSNGSIQFLQSILQTNILKKILCLNPLKRVNSILTQMTIHLIDAGKKIVSQSPQTGQFNSYIV